MKKTISILATVGCFAICYLPSAILQAQDMGVTALVAPPSPLCAASGQTVTVTIQNFDAADIDFSVNPTDVVADITGPVAQSFTLTVSTGTLVASGTMNVDVTAAADFSAAGTYTVNANTVLPGDLTPANDAMAPVNITVNALPVVTLGADVTQCGGTVLLNAGNPGSTYLWSDASTDQTLTVSATGTYSVDVTNSCGTVSDAIDVTIKTPPSVNLGFDIFQCGGAITLDAGNPGSTYVWSTGDTTQTINVSSSGNYWAVAYNSCGNSTDNINIEYYPSGITVNLGPDATVCGSVALDAGNPGLQYIWSTGSTATTQTITVSSSGTYFVEVSDTLGCKGYDTVNITSTGVNPLVQGFELTAFPPAGWTIIDPDNSIKWSRTTLAAKTGAASMFMNNHAYSAIGQKDEIVSPVLCDLAGADLTFQVAYQLYTNPSLNPNYSDTLRVQYSTDGGVIWTTVYNKYGASGSNQLTTAIPAYSASPFVPTSTQWRKETVALPNVAQMLVKFVNINSYENRLYIDDINISNPVGAEEIILDDYVSVFPNPSSGSIFVTINKFDLGYVNMKVYTIAGAVISETTSAVSVPAKFNFDLSNRPGGMYLLEVKSENNRIVKKVILNK